MARCHGKRRHALYGCARCVEYLYPQPIQSIDGPLLLEIKTKEWNRLAMGLSTA